MWNHNGRRQQSYCSSNNPCVYYRHKRTYDLTKFQCDKPELILLILLVVIKKKKKPINFIFQGASWWTSVDRDKRLLRPREFLSSPYDDKNNYERSARRFLWQREDKDNKGKYFWGKIADTVITYVKRKCNSRLIENPNTVIRQYRPETNLQLSAGRGMYRSTEF